MVVVERGQRVRRDRAGESEATAALRRIGLHEHGAQLGGLRVGQEVARDADGLPVPGGGVAEQGVDVDGGPRVGARSRARRATARSAPGWRTARRSPGAGREDQRQR